MKKMLLALLIIATPQTASAETCHETIAGMFEGGALDPFVRPPHRLTNTVTDAEGNFVRRYLTRWQTPFRSVSGVEGGGLFALVIDADSWTGPSLDGPWTKSPNSLPADHNDVRKAQHNQEKANLTDGKCLGTVDLDGSNYDVVSYVTKTDPNPKMNDMWFGARHTVYIDPETARVMRWESTDFVSSFAPNMSKEVQVQIFEYDPDLVIPRPE
ncbi:hypothetical protein [Roseibium sp.]|uniref:hypothetical protein n=1 Tax=Roseibium sp. TaxID=1936156 RepID=UPI003B52A173